MSLLSVLAALLPDNYLDIYVECTLGLPYPNVAAVCQSHTHIHSRRLPRGLRALGRSSEGITS